MSEFTIINDVSLEMRRRIFAAMNSASGVTLDFTDELSNIVLAPPQDTFGSGTLLSLYLYHVEINHSTRNQQMLSQRGSADSLRLPPLPLKLHYLATPVDDSEETNQLIIGRLLQLVYDNPSIGTIDNTPLGNSFGGAANHLRIIPDPLTVEQLSQLWNAFSQPLRLSMSFQVDVVAIDSSLAPKLAPRVVDVLSVSGVKERD